MEINSIIDLYYSLSIESKTLLLNKINKVNFTKGSIILDADKVEKKIYFIKKGIVRAFTIVDGDEVTFWFGEEGSSILSMRSYIENKPSYEFIEVLEDSELYEISIAELQALYESNLDLANWGRKLAEIELIKTEERLIARELGTAIQRYKKLLIDNPGLVNRVKLAYIASYLGISQVQLSRIRSEI